MSMKGNEKTIETRTLVTQGGYHEAAQIPFSRFELRRHMCTHHLPIEKNPNQMRQPGHPGGGDHPVFQ